MREQRIVSISVVVVMVAIAIWRSMKRRKLQISWWRRVPMAKASMDQIELVTGAKDANRLAQQLRQFPVIGLDCEWVKEGRVALLQLAVFDEKINLTKCFIFRLPNFPIKETPHLIELLSNADQLKVGVGIKGDARRLGEDYGLEVCHFLDLRHMTSNSRIEPGGLASLVRQTLGRKLDKNWKIQTSNWEAVELSEEQLVYAADDALAGLQVYAAFHDICDNIEDLTKENINIDYRQNTKPRQAKTKREAKQKKAVEPSVLKCVEVYLKEGPLYRRHPHSFKHKAKWYVRKNLATVVEDSDTKFVVQFTFPAEELDEYKHGLRPKKPATAPAAAPTESRFACEGVSFNTSENDNQCVVCASKEALIRRILVPREYRKHFPLAVHAKRDVVLLCLSCHSLVNEHDQVKRKELALQFNAPIGSVINCEDRKKARCAGNALVRNGHKMPAVRKAELEESVVSFFKVPFTEDLAKLASELSMKRDEGQHGERVVAQLGADDDEAELHQFQLMWRDHFIEKMKPKFMPGDWHDWKE